jgi:LysR family carnitine catabolism transcriptional activator
MRINISPNQLRAVLAVAADSSFTSAASKLNLSQPALSRIVRSVEEELGCAIFDRDTRNVSPTRAGITMLAIIRTALSDYETAVERLRYDALGKSGIVRVATLPSLALTLLAPAIVEMRARAPDVEIGICDGLSEVVVEQVMNGEVDVGLVDRPTGHPNLDFHELVRDRVGLVCLEEDPLAGQKTVEWSVFEQRPFIAMAEGSSVRTLIDNALLQARLTVRPLYEPSFLTTVGALVITGAGITALPEFAMRGLQQEHLKWIPLKNPTVIRSSGYLLRADRKPQPAASTLLQVLRSMT